MNATRIWRPGAFGDVVCLMSLLSGTKSKLPDELPVAVATETFRQLGPLSESIHFPNRTYLVNDGVLDHTGLRHDPNTSKLIGYPFNLDGTPRLMEKHLMEYFAEELDIMCPDPRAMGAVADYVKLEVPVLDAIESNGLDQYVTIQTHAGWSKNKNWKWEYYAEVVKHLHKMGYMVVQIGHRSEEEVPGVDVYLSDFTTCMTQHIGVQSRAVVHIGPDSVFNHTSAIRWNGTYQVPSVIIWGSTNPAGFGYPHNHNIYLNLPCQPCYGVNHCKLEETYPQVCTHAVNPEMVISAVSGMLAPKEPLPMPDPAPKKNRPTIGVSMIVKNESAEILKALETAKDADEIVVCDTGSTDDTRELVAGFDHPNLKQCEFEWEDHFAKARNHSLSQVTSDWVVILDADERLAFGFIDKLRTIIDELPAGITTIRPAVSPVNNPNESFYGVRVFRNNGEIKWVGRAHEVPNKDDQHNEPLLQLHYGYSPAHSQDPNRVLRMMLKAMKDEYLTSGRVEGRTLYYLAREFFYRDNFKEAARLFKWRVEEIGYRSECADAWLYLARCYWNMNRGDEAREAAAQSLLMVPGCKETLLLLAEMSYDKEAAQWRALAEKADNENVLFVRAK